MAKTKTNSTKETITETKVMTDLDNALYDLKQEGLTENKDFHVHEYVHGYLDIRFDGFYSRRAPIEFRPNGSLIQRDPYGREVVSSG